MKSIGNAAVLIFVLITFNISAQEKDSVISAEMLGHIFKPKLVEATTEKMESLQMPDGFRINKFAEDLGKPRIIVVGEDGTVYVSRRSKNDVLMLKDSDGDGVADQQKSIIKKEGAHGLAIHDGWFYLVTVNDVFRAKLKGDGSVGKLIKIVEKLPDGGQHANRTIAFGPDGKLYISVGSTCNACEETDKESASMLVADADGSNRRIFAEGLRNTIGFDWHPKTGELWAMDHGMDWLGDTTQKEELNLLKDGKNYGWPYLFDNDQKNLSDEPPGMSWEEYAKKTEVPVLMHTAHSAPMALVFYEGDMFPKEYRNKAFVSFHGSWNRKPAAGYYVQLLDFEGDKPTEFRDFITGWLSEDGQSIFGRPVGLAEHVDGSLLITDDTNGVIYRVSYGQ